MSEQEIPIAERIGKVLDHLGIGEAHFAGAQVEDWSPLISQIPERVSSLTLVSSSSGMPPELLAAVEPKLLLLSGDTGPLARFATSATAGLNNVLHCILKDYEHAGWSDIVADRTDEVVAATISFINEFGDLEPLSYSASDSEGEYLEVTYRIRGSGAPLLLLPIGLAPSQWEPAIPRLAEHFTTIVLGGRHLGMIRRLEERAVQGYRDMVDQLVNRLRLSPGEKILDVGCGTGAHDRYISRITNRNNHIVGVDHSGYMIKEAMGIARSEGMGDSLDLRVGDATKLPLNDDGFDAVFSITVMEEVDAEKMISEMVRVAKPGGRVAAIIRAVDLPWIVNAPLPVDMKRKVEAPNFMGSGVGQDGCADASLYSKLTRAGLKNVQMFPQLMTFPGRQNWESQARGALSAEESKIWDDSVEQARAEGTYFISMPFHCAVGTKPS